MNLGELARELKILASRGGGFGSDVERALVALAVIFEKKPDWSLEDIDKALKPRATRAKKVVTFDDVAPSEIVADYVEQLGQKHPASDALRVLDAIMKDKRVKRDELYEIAGRFLGAKLSFKKKAEAEAAIRDRLTRRDWDQASIKILNDRAKT